MIIDDLDVKLIFVKEGSVLNRHSHSREKFIHGIKVLMAKNIDNLSEEKRKGLLEKVEGGEFPALAPLGYRHNKANKTIELDEQRAPIIQEMFEFYASGEYSIRSLQAHVTGRGLTTRKGNRMVRSSVAEMLKNPFYYGDFIWAGKQYHGEHPPIIDKVLFDRVQAVIGNKNRTRESVHGFAYTGLLRCGGKYVWEKGLQRQFGKILRKFEFSNVVFDWTREALRLNQAEKASFHRKAIEELNARYRKLQNRIYQIHLDKLDGEIEEAFYRKHMKEWREEQNHIPNFKREGLSLSSSHLLTLSVNWPRKPATIRRT